MRHVQINDMFWSDLIEGVRSQCGDHLYAKKMQFEDAEETYDMWILLDIQSFIREQIIYENK